MRLIRLERPASCQHHERQNHVVYGNGCRNGTGNTIKGQLTLREQRGELLLGHSVAESQQRHREEEDVVSRVESVPECTCAVNSHEVSASTNVDISRQPEGCLLVPVLGHHLHVRSKFETKNVHIARRLPAFGFSFLIKSIETSIPDVLSSFRILPSKVVLLAKCKQSDPTFCVAFQPRESEERFREDDRGILLGIFGIKERKLGTEGNKSSKT
mmetsp:Transcript_30998/g.47886  ORF Transcript_30998/g.47886 Transcript_30998/m.47886 type:complete len:214 (+) Transcript_30998:116-757(+)